MNFSDLESEQTTLDSSMSELEGGARPAVNAEPFVRMEEGEAALRRSAKAERQRRVRAGLSQEQIAVPMLIIRIMNKKDMPTTAF